MMMLTGMMTISTESNLTCASRCQPNASRIPDAVRTTVQLTAAAALLAIWRQASRRVLMFIIRSLNAPRVNATCLNAGQFRS